MEVQVEGKGTTGLREWAGAIWTWTQGFFLGGELLNLWFAFGFWCYGLCTGF